MCIMFVLLHMHIHHPSSTMAFSCAKCGFLGCVCVSARARTKDREICVTCGVAVIVAQPKGEPTSTQETMGKFV